MWFLSFFLFFHNTDLLDDRMIYSINDTLHKRYELEGVFERTSKYVSFVSSNGRCLVERSSYVFAAML